MKYLSPFHCKNGYANAPLCYVIRTLPVLLWHIEKLFYLEATN